MIIDNWENRFLYADLIPFYREGIAFAESLVELPAGRYESEHGIFALVQTGMTADISEQPFECHRNYIDLQWVCEGEESLEWTNLNNTTGHTPYVPDVELVAGQGDVICIAQNQFYIMFPQDAHKCCGNVGTDRRTSCSYKKIVLKLPWEVDGR
jgi:YhcH/YjgK/YiaL family protein